MAIFISYPRALQEKAEKIDSLLVTRKHKTFFDKEAIKASDAWRSTIIDQIKKSNIYIIIFTAINKENSSYFETETELISREVRENPKKRIISILFPPCEISDIPIFFREFHLVKKNEDDDNDDLWTNEVVHSVEKFSRWNFLSNLSNNFDYKFLYAIPLLLFFSLFFYKNIFSYFGYNIEIKNKDYFCQKIYSKETFQLAAPYKYVTDSGFVSESNNGNFTVTGNCKKIQDGGFSLELKEYTEQDVFFFIGDEQVYFGKSTNKHKSWIYFDKSGIPVRRRFKTPERSEITVDCRKDIFEKKMGEGQCYVKSEEYKDLVSKRHERDKNTFGSCQIAFKDDLEKGIMYIASICNKYVRAMKH